MSRVFMILYQAAIAVSIASSERNQDTAINVLQPFRDTMCEELCKGIRECSSAAFNQNFLRCLLMKVTGMSDMTIFHLSTQSCYPSKTRPRTRENRMRGNRCQQKGTVMRRKNLDCKDQSYMSVRAGRETIHGKYHSEKRTWDEASEICHSEGATLAMPDSKAKEKAMMSLTPFNTDVWIGLRDLGKNGTFSWVDGSSLSYQHWGYGEPGQNHGNNDDNCVAVVSSFRISIGTRYHWADFNCSFILPFTCQCFQVSHTDSGELLISQV